MLVKPYLALTTDRSKLSKRHPFSGAPEDWLINAILKQRSLFGVSFDFFVNWNNNVVSNEFWVKRIVKTEYAPWPITDKGILQQKIYDCDSMEYVKVLSRFASKYNVILKYQLFKESNSWNDDMTIISVVFNNNGEVSHVINKRISDLKEDIKSLSGGPISIGKKGLIYSTSTLEGYLSRTDAAWPGDADLVILDKALNPVALLEYKKHTLDTPIKDQQLSNYYPYPDKRKYDRLAILRSFLGIDTPFINIYYPTNPVFQSIKFEKISGAISNLRSSEVKGCYVPKNQSEYPNVVDSILEFLGE
jgi:hypothetical protein